MRPILRVVLQLIRTTARQSQERRLKSSLQPGDPIKTIGDGGAFRVQQGHGNIYNPSEMAIELDARLIKMIPMRRLRLISGDASKPPKVGDLGETDQCFTGSWGRQMVLVYFLAPDGTEWEAEAYESEIERFKAPDNI